MTHSYNPASSSRPLSHHTNLFELASSRSNTPSTSMLPFLTRSGAAQAKAPGALAAMSGATATVVPSGGVGSSHAAVVASLDTSSSSTHAHQPSTTTMQRRQFRSRLDQSLGRKHFELHPASMARAVPTPAPRSRRSSSARQQPQPIRGSVASSSTSPVDGSYGDSLRTFLGQEQLKN